MGEPMSFAATVLTLYPEMFPGPLAISLAGRALERGDWTCETVQIRDFATDKHRTVDDTPAGGGAGMVLRADVLAAALDHVLDTNRNHLRSYRAERAARSRDTLAELGGVSTDDRLSVPVLAGAALISALLVLAESIALAAMAPKGVNHDNLLALAESSPKFF